jgi:hypothetical protein
MWDVLNGQIIDLEHLKFRLKYFALFKEPIGGLASAFLAKGVLLDRHSVFLITKQKNGKTKSC